MIYGIGTDIIEIERIRKAITRPSFVARVYTEEEARYAESKGKQSTASFAARFAAKEAVLKALGTGLRGGKLRQIEILTDSLGAPYIRLTGAFLAQAKANGITRIYISLSHAREYATAVCIMESEKDEAAR